MQRQDFEMIVHALLHYLLTQTYQVEYIAEM